MPSALDIPKTGHLQSNGLHRLTCTFQTDDDRREVWAELEEQACRAWIDSPARGDAWTRLLIFEMMRIGGEFKINAPVSLTLLRNLENFTEAFIKWYPDKLHPVTLSPEQIIDDTQDPVDDSALVCFSGGLDAAFSAYRHTSGQAGRNTLNIKAGFLGAGLDVPLAKEQLLLDVEENARLMLKDLGIDKLYVIRCNYQNVFHEHAALWGELSHLAVLAGLASFLAPSGYRNLIAGSSAPYDTLTIPWSSQPITDHLLSQRQFRVYPDGHGFSRTEKAEKLKNWPFGVSRLRVCWENPQPGGKNCGQCEKCKRTILNFKACGAEHLLEGCMPSVELSSRDIRSIDLATLSLRHTYQTLLQFCRQRHLSEPWVKDVEFLLNYKKPALWHLCRKRRITRKLYRIFFGRQNWKLN